MIAASLFSAAQDPHDSPNMPGRAAKTNAWLVGSCWVRHLGTPKRMGFECTNHLLDGPDRRDHGHLRWFSLCHHSDVFLPDVFRSTGYRAMFLGYASVPK